MQSSSLTRTMPSLGALEAGAGGADGDARGVGAVQAGLREVDDAGRRRSSGTASKVWTRLRKVPRGSGAVGVGVGERADGRGAGVPLLAGDDAGVAADAGVEVDDEAEARSVEVGRAVIGGGRLCGHIVRAVRALFSLLVFRLLPENDCSPG